MLPGVLCQKQFLMLKVRVSASGFYFLHLILRSYDNNMHVEGLLLANLCLFVNFIKLGTMFAI